MSPLPALIEHTTITDQLLARLRSHVGDGAYAEMPAAINGGYDTSIFSFRLSGALAPWDGPLILRMFRSEHGDRPRIESAVQNAVADLAYPCPPALLAGGDDRVGGRPYLIMERVWGASSTTSRSLDAGRRTFPLSEAGAAHAYIESRAAFGRVVLVV